MREGNVDEGGRCTVYFLGGSERDKTGVRRGESGGGALSKS